MKALRVLLASVLVFALLGGRAAARQAKPRFYWGVATAGFQSEGSAPDSNWSRYVARHTSAIKDPYRDSVDFRHRYGADIALAKGMGVNTFRFSVEWARVEPKRGKWDQSALRYYDDVVKKVTQAGMTPMITLSHFVHPGWVADQGAWNNGRTSKDFLTFAQAIVERYKGRGALWVTFNEPTVYTQDELQNQPGTDPGRMLGNLVAAHRAAYTMIHRVDPGSKVTSNIAFIPAAQAVFDAMFTDRVADRLDFVGIDYYYGLSLDNLTAASALTGEFWKIKPQPDGIYHALMYYHDRFPKLPLYVVENGMPTDNGKARADGYTRAQDLRDTIYWMRRARAAGADVIGYNYWSITDNYEWGSYRPRFGLYTVNVLTDPSLRRRPTDAVAAYRKIIHDGGVPGTYKPVLPPAFCSLVTLLKSCLNPPH